MHTSNVQKIVVVRGAARAVAIVTARAVAIVKTV
jgi:hypothetical protein